MTGQLDSGVNDEFAERCIDPGKVHESQIAAPVKNQFALVDLDPLGMMRGMTMDQVDSGLFYQQMGEVSLCGGNGVPSYRSSAARRLPQRKSVMMVWESIV